ncbi:glycosyl hydrolase [Streptomyces sulfonofaciens]|uniref:Glycosyl hydrolase n=1 Tax=Streptomyces sulfonofaciens TaxID=68272 RepID=A0A919GRM8_9ACTN|nr:glycoside hydrolase family 3 C-terminal domain-containing protein [Streptomyces sulfonofaciens]GHH88983.1 glycosyl hydrolase [Streptomyces sulfonofaciens]
MAEAEAEVGRLVEKLDLVQKVRLLTGASTWRTAAEPAIGLGAMTFSDGPAGVRGEQWDERLTSLVLPSPTALGAAWHPPLAAELGALLAAQARCRGVDAVLAPTLNLHRSPLGGRHFECFSEDPLLAGALGAAVVRGLQGAGVAAAAKHFVANDAEAERLTVDVRVSERVLREVYLAPFEAAVEAGVWLVMPAYNRVNGTTMSASPLLADPLKAEWGFDGVTVSDWGAVRSTVEPAAAALDLAMPGPGGPWGEALVDAVRDGRVPQAAVDDKVRRLLRLAHRVGALGAGRPAPPGPSAPAGPNTQPDATAARAGRQPAARALLRRAASAGTVLLRNTGALPLDPAGIRTLAVIGRHAASPRTQGGGSAEVFPDRVVTPLDGIRAALPPAARVLHEPGPGLGAAPAPLDGRLARDPDTAEPGVRLRVLDAAGRVLHSEHRLCGRILEPPVPPGARTVELSARLTPRPSGEWTFAVAGFGRMSLTVDGVPLVDGTFPRETDDPTGVHVRPPRRTGRLALAAGRPVTVVARRELAEDTGRATILSAAPPPVDDTAALAAAVAAARAADAAVVVVGTTEESESEGLDRDGLELPGRQDELVRAVLAVQPRTVVCVNSGGPVALPWHTAAAALLLTWFPGGEGGHALADVLFGRTEPGGRLPTTWGAALADVPVHTTRPSPPGVLAYAEGLHIGYRAWLRSPAAPAYWFGHGLGYTTWAYEALSTAGGAAADGAAGTAEGVRTEATRAEEARAEEAVVRVRVRNTGPRPGREVVQLYLARPGSAVERPVRWLAGFAEAIAAPGETVTVRIPVAGRALRHWSSDERRWRVEPGVFTVLVGRSAGDIRLRGELTAR